MSSAGTDKKPRHGDIGDAAARGRGSNALKRLELPLAGIRKASAKTQVEVAESCGMGQGDVSRLEGQEDMMLSTLERYAHALGARVEVVFVYPNGTRIQLVR